MKRGTAKHSCVGKRVRIPVYTDLWMRGATVGTVERVVVADGKFIDPKDPRGKDILVVRMDHPQVRRLARVIADDCSFV